MKKSILTIFAEKIDNRKGVLHENAKPHIYSGKGDGTKYGSYFYTPDLAPSIIFSAHCNIFKEKIVY